MSAVKGFGLQPVVKDGEPVAWAFVTPTDEQRKLWEERSLWEPTAEQRAILYPFAQ